MMERLIERGEAIARRAQAQRLQQIAAELRDRGMAVEAVAGSVILRGRRIVQQWLVDPLLRFAGRAGA